jgi:hypothetical protein
MAFMATGGASTGPIQKTQILDDKGAALGIPAPAWVQAYVSGSNLTVEALPEFESKGVYCFVIEQNDANRDYAINWVQNASGPAQVAAKISTTVSASASNKLAGEKGADVQSNLSSAQEVLSNAVITGLTKNGDWWQTVRNKETEVTETRAFAIYTIEKNTLNEQVARYLQRFIDDKNAALSEAEKAIYADLITEIRNKGGINS